LSGADEPREIVVVEEEKKGILMARRFFRASGLTTYVLRRIGSSSSISRTLSKPEENI